MPTSFIAEEDSACDRWRRFASRPATTDSGNLEVESTGLCPAPTTTFGPYLYEPLPIRVGVNVVALPNPPVDRFNEDVY